MQRRASKQMRQFPGNSKKLSVRDVNTPHLHSPKTSCAYLKLFGDKNLRTALGYDCGMSRTKCNMAPAFIAQVSKSGLCVSVQSCYDVSLMKI